MRNSEQIQPHRNIVKPKPARYTTTTKHNHNQTYEIIFFSANTKKKRRTHENDAKCNFHKSFFRLLFTATKEWNTIFFVLVCCSASFFIRRFIRIVLEFAFNKWKQRRGKKRRATTTPKELLNEIARIGIGLACATAYYGVLLLLVFFFVHKWNE